MSNNPRDEVEGIIRQYSPRLRRIIVNYKLDPCHYMSSPGLSWDAMLKMTKINLEVISDIDMQLFIEKGMRGGISYIAHRHGKANNKYMKDYD